MRRFFARFTSLLRGENAERELSREIDSHLALLQENFERRGLSPAEAQLEARRSYGGVEQAKELHREARSILWIEHLAKDPAIRSNTSVCLQFTDRTDEDANKARQKAIVKLLEAEDAAYDIGAYRDAPPGIRIWCGATVDTADIEKLGPWLDWAWDETRP